MLKCLPVTTKISVTMVANRLFIPTAISLTNFSIFLNSVIWTPKFQCLIIIYENRTQAIANEILNTEVAKVRDKLIINMDLNVPLNKFDDIKHSTTSNKYFVISIIRLYFNNYIRKFIKYLPSMAHHLIITKTKNMNTKFVHQLLMKISDLKKKKFMFTVTFLQVITDNNLKLHFVMGFHKRHVSTINPMNYIKNMPQLLNQLYFEKFNNMESGLLNIESVLEFPNLFNAKRYNKMSQTFEIGVGGVHAHIATLIKAYLNATIAFNYTYYEIESVNGQPNASISYDVDLIAPIYDIYR